VRTGRPRDRARASRQAPARRRPACRVSYAASEGPRQTNGESLLTPRRHTVVAGS
jgi:hypothetical protein